MRIELEGKVTDAIRVEGVGLLRFFEPDAVTYAVES